MTGVQRFLKKASIISLILAVILIIIWPKIQPKEDPCFNGLLDAGEDEIDCGGFCAKACPAPDKPPMVDDVKIEWSQALKDGPNNYDLIAKLNNTNRHWGATSVDYKFTLYGVNEDVIGSKIGSTYIVPLGFSEGQGVKYVIVNNFPFEGDIKKTDFQLTEFHWSEVKDVSELPEVGVDTIQIKDQDYGRIKDGNGYYYVYGVTDNTSKYSFRQVDIYTVLYDKNEKPVAAGKTDQKTLGSGGGWEFRIFWNYKFAADVARVEYVAETNIYEQGNFMRNYGTGKKYYTK